MKDNIKNIFDNAIESDDTNINAEKIQNTVMKRLGKQARENLKLSDTEEAVEPVFVAAPQKKGKFTALKIAAGAAAACLGVVVIGNIVNLNNDGFSPLSESDSGTEVNLTEESSENTVNEVAETTNTATSDSVDSSDHQYQYHMTGLGSSLMDCTAFEYNYVTETLSLNFTNSFNIISEKDGRLYLLDSLIMKREDGERSPDKELTDYFNSNTPFVRTVVNEYRSQLLEFLVVGGNISDNDYGYVIMHRISNTDKWIQISKFSAKTTEMIGTSASDREMPQWYLDTLEQLKEKFPNQEITVAKDGCFSEYADFKAAEEDVPTVDCVPNLSDYSYATLVENPIVEFRLLDGSLIQYSKEKGVSHHGNENPNYLLSYKDGRLYYTGNGQNKDITDLISNGNYFQDYYINSVTGFKHYIIISGDLDKKDFGYIDLFKISEEDEGEKCILWSFDGTWNFDSDKYIGKEVDDDEDIYHSDWWDNIQEVIYEKLSENHTDDEYVILNGGGGCTDLSKVN